MGKLYLVGTPIGNLGDFSPRANETLKMVDFIAAEDTRVTMKLLSRFEIHKPMVSYYEHNLRERGEQIVARIQAGENCAIVTDAGMPCISDPGEDLVRLCAQSGIEVVAVPGPSAAVTALALSGLSTSRFTFEGFLSVRKKSRVIHMEEIKRERKTMIFYEAPHKLLSTLEDLLNALGDRRVALGRELTKLHEEVIRTTLAEALAFYREHTPKGEFVLVLEGAQPEEEAEMTLDEAVEMARAFQEQGASTAEAAKRAASASGLPKSEIYRQMLE